MIRDFLKEVLRNGDDMFIQTEVKLDEVAYLNNNQMNGNKNRKRKIE